MLLCFSGSPAFAAVSVDFHLRLRHFKAVFLVHVLPVSFLQIHVHRENTVAGKADGIVHRRVMGIFIAGEAVGHGGRPIEQPLLRQGFAVTIHRGQTEAGIFAPYQFIHLSCRKGAGSSPGLLKS